MEYDTLTELYGLRARALEFGIDLTGDPRIVEAEDEYLASVIVPTVERALSPLLARLQGKHGIVIDYEQDAPLYVRTTRQRIDVDTDARLHELPVCRAAAVAPRRARTPQDGSEARPARARATTLRITLDDGTVIAERTAALTFTRFVEAMGCEAVAALGLSCAHEPLVARTRGVRNCGTTADGWYVATQTSTGDKHKYINRIAHALGRDVKVEVY